VLLALLAGTAAAGSGIQGTCDVRFRASSTLHDFSGSARSRPFAAPIAKNGEGKATLPAVELEFPVADMRTGNDSRDGKMREMFQADRYPVIRAAARDLDADSLRERMRKERGGTVPLTVFLAIRGMERKIQATAGNWKEERERFSFDVEFPVSLREFGLEPPSVLGIIRVADRVDVKGSITVTVQGAP
jgi:hypothetical protein